MNLKKPFLNIVDKRYFKKINIFFDKYINSNNLITFIDIGAADFIDKRWSKICDNLEYIGFEPDDRSYQKLVKEYSINNKYKFYNFALWSKNGTIEINLCKEPKVSSFFIPNKNIINNFNNPERFNIVKKETVKVIRLDEIKLNNADFIKLDIQGGELEALKGADKTLDKVLGCEVEVEFVQLYKNQPIFDDINKFLISKNFIFIDFISYNRWERKKYEGLGQLVFADALFLKSPEYLLSYKEIDENYVRKYIAICSLYNKFDLVEKTYEIFQHKYGKDFVDINLLNKLIKDNIKKRKLKKFIDKLVRIFIPGSYLHLLD
jgi:FkbM family methyltransferase